MKRLVLMLTIFTIGFTLAGCQNLDFSKDIVCDSNEVYNEETETCDPITVECPEGEVLENGVCVTVDPVCELGTHMENGVCVENPDDDVITDLDSKDDILALFNQFNERRNTIYNSWFFGFPEMAVDDAVDAPAEDKGSDDYSETNNQVAGVDEMDNVLTDGKFIYVQNWEKVQITLAYTLASTYEALALEKEITFEELRGDNGYFYPVGMYVDEDRFLIIGNQTVYSCDETAQDKFDSGDDIFYNECGYYNYKSFTKVFEYDKNSDFELLNEYTLSGSFVGTRKINDDLYFVTNEYIPFWMEQYEDYDFNLDSYLPSFSINNETTSLTYNDILYVEGTEPTSYTSFYGIDLETGDIDVEVMLGEGGYNLYVSTESIYLTGTKWVWDEEVYQAMLDAETDEITSNPYELSTSIVKVAIEDGNVDYITNGTVEGMNLDQFSMDEKDGFLRIVTSENNWWWWGTNEEINNRLTILDSDLNVVSVLDNLGKPGETVQSTRFVGDYAYVVTFLRTDPFYVIDVSDPYNPVVTGELEIPGFSDFLQPIGEDYMLGIGYGDNEGGTQGLKISLYDISDKTDAKVASEIIYPYSNNSYMWTSTVYNHKDLLVALSKGIIALPYTENGFNEEDHRWYYNTGVLVLNIDEENGLISERAKVSHSETNQYDTYVFKSKFISDYLYTVSSKFIKVSTIEDPTTILNSLQIGESYEIDMPVEVEPEEVDPEVCVDGEINENGECVVVDFVCVDGYVLLDGECVLIDNIDVSDVTYNDFEHIMNWEELTFFGEYYEVYVYSENCSYCEEIKEEMFQYGMDNLRETPIFFIDIHAIEGEVPSDISGTPTLLIIEGETILESIVGYNSILDYIQ